jgi:hypothetical protein
MSLQNYLSNPVQRRFCRIDLGKYVLTGDIFIYHAVNRLNLTDDLF